jgi:hypothetical protein
LRLPFFKNAARVATVHAQYHQRLVKAACGEAPLDDVPDDVIDALLKDGGHESREHGPRLEIAIKYVDLYTAFFHASEQHDLGEAVRMNGGLGYLPAMYAMLGEEKYEALDNAVLEAHNADVHATAETSKDIGYLHAEIIRTIRKVDKRTYSDDKHKVFAVPPLPHQFQDTLAKLQPDLDNYENLLLEEDVLDIVTKDE